jgi:hypothetical protein
MKPVGILDTSMSMDYIDDLAAYPPSDDEVRDYFCKHGQTSTAALQVHCAAFLISLFDHLYETLRQQARAPRATLAHALYSIFHDGSGAHGRGSHRIALLDSVIQSARRNRVYPVRMRI